MMPLGSQNSGGRSSNLSPLAPPFTLDKPYQNQHNSKPPMVFTETAYGPRFDRPRPVWSPPVNSTFGPNFPENSSKDGGFPPQDVHGFPGSQPNNSSSSSTRLAPLSSPSGNAGYDGSTYGQYSNPIQSTLAEAKPYYPPYVVPDDREMVARKEPNYDLLSNFGVAQMSGAPQVDGTRTVSGVKYTPQWNGVWNCLNDVEQGNWLDLGGNYASKDHKHSEPSTGQQGKRKVSYVETPIKSTNCFDGFGGENSFGSPSIEDRKSFKEPNPAVTSIRLSALGSETTQDAFMQHPFPSYGFCEGPVNSQDKHTNYSDSYVFDSTSTVRSSPTNKNKMTYGGFPSPQYAVPSAKMDSVRNEALDKTEKSPDFLPYHPFGLNFDISNYTGNTDSLFTGSSSNKSEANVNKKQVNEDSFDHSLSTVPHLSMAECLKIKGSTGEAFYPKDKFSDGPDIQNVAEDSPCWKGAHFSPFVESKMVIPDIVLEMSESCFNQNGKEEHMNNPIRLYTTDGTDTTHVSGELSENLASKRSPNFKPVSREHDGSCSMIQGLHSAKLFGEDGFQSSDKKRALDLEIGNDLGYLNYSGIVSSSNKSQPLQINLEGCEILPKETGAELKGKNSSDGLSSSPTNAGDEMLHSPPGNVSASMTTQLSGKVSSPKVDINVLVNTMMNLSEVLISHCSNSHDTSTELIDASVKGIISNLNSFLLKKADQAPQTEKSQDPQQETSCVQGSLQALMVSKVTSARMDQHDHDFFKNWNNDIQCLSNEDHSGSSSVKGNAETVRDAETIQAMKSVLEKNFPSEEMQPETVLYKNLWLEAEAALCATTIKSRFNRVKKETEKEKRVYQQTNEEENVPISKAAGVNKAVESSPNDSPRTDTESSVIARFRTLTSVVEDLKSTNRIVGRQSPSLDTEARQMPAFSSPQSQASDFEASVMSRFHTLKSRADNSDLVSTEDEKSPPIKDNFGPPSPDQSMENSYFSSMANHIADPEAAFMSRFSILKARGEQPDSLDYSNMGNLTGLFPTSPNSAGNKARKVIGLGDEILEGWYDCSEPGWEHVTKEEAPKQK